MNGTDLGQSRVSRPQEGREPALSKLVQRAVGVSWAGGWCFEPSQPLGIASGLGKAGNGRAATECPQTKVAGHGGGGFFPRVRG